LNGDLDGDSNGGGIPSAVVESSSFSTSSGTLMKEGSIVLSFLADEDEAVLVSYLVFRVTWMVVGHRSICLHVLDSL
jgi:hypothetical protein